MHFILWVLTYETKAKKKKKTQHRICNKKKGNNKRNKKIMKILNNVVGQASECKK